jgi:hypothetical protein
MADAKIGIIGLYLAPCRAEQSKDMGFWRWFIAFVFIDRVIVRH